MSEKANAKQFPKFYYAKHMHPGVCGYDEEIILIDTEAMKAMAKSFNGKPVYVLHDERSQEERMADISSADGYVTETFYNETDGWLWSKIMIVTDAGHEYVAKGWSVSNAYIPTNSGQGGTKHNVQYQREILSAEFTHLAIVDNPRYEDACIMTPEEFKIYQEKNREQLNEYKNSKKQKGYTMSFFKKTKQKVTEIDDETFAEVTNAKGEVVEVSVSKMIAAIVDDQEKKNSMHKVGGKEMSEEEIVAKYQEIQNKKSKKNSDEEDEKENDDDAEEKDNDDDTDDEKENEEDDSEKENESDDEEKDNEDDDGEKKNSAKSKKSSFKEIKNAHKKKPAVRTFDTPQNKLDRGKTRYGTSK